MSKSDIVNKKFIKTYNVDDYEVETDEGFVDIVSIHKTIEYLMYEIQTLNGLSLKCADTHILFDQNMNEKFCYEFAIGDFVITKYGIDTISNIECLGYYENMYDLELSETSNHRYYTNEFLSHNTLLAKKLAEEIYGGENSLIRFDMSEYSDRTSASKLYGTAAGYIGFEQGGLLTEAIKNKKHCVLLLDEIEKADKDVLNVFLQVFDDGVLTDNTGQKVSFNNVIIMMTSNIGAKDVAQFSKGVGFNSNVEDNKKNISSKALKECFPPEFLNRLDSVVYFNQLNDNNMKAIIELELNNLNNRLKDINYGISYNQEVIEYVFNLVKLDQSPGARKVSRVIQNEIENTICDMYLEKDFDENYVFNVIIEDKKIKII